MATTAWVIFAGLSVKRSSNSQMLKTMLASGLMMTRSGWDTLNGLTCRADCSSSVPVTREDFGRDLECFYTSVGQDRVE